MNNFFTTTIRNEVNLLPRVRLAGSRPYVRQLICNKLLFSSNIEITAWGNGAARRPLAFFLHVIKVAHRAEKISNGPPRSIISNNPPLENGGAYNTDLPHCAVKKVVEK